MRILVTGAAGSIGSVVCAGLVERGHTVVGLDRKGEPEAFVGSWFTADCADADAVAAAFASTTEAGPLDGVVHLASIPHEAALPEILTSHVVTTAAVLDAMVEHGIDRIVHASSNHAVGRTPRSQLLEVSVRPRPDTFYGVGKVAAEALLGLYADRYGIDAVTSRIGSFLPRPETRRHLSTWLSPGDCVRMVEAGLTAPAPGLAVIHGVSDNTRGWWDLAPGRALGYHPLDDAERFAAEVESAPASEDDAAEAAHVGGGFVAEELHRPALDRS